MTAFFLGGEPGSEPIVGALDSHGATHRVERVGIGPEGQKVVFLGGVVDHIDAPVAAEAPAVLTPDQTQRRMDASSSAGYIAIAS